jgi:hypothetical protein
MHTPFSVNGYILLHRLLKKTQKRGARRSMSGGVLLSYVDAKSIERNDAYEFFSAVCYAAFLLCQRLINRSLSCLPRWLNA